MKNFNTQVCTTKKQSQRLLELGLKKETSDCRWMGLVKDARGNAIPVKNRFGLHGQMKMNMRWFAVTCDMILFQHGRFTV